MLFTKYCTWNAALPKFECEHCWNMSETRVARLTHLLGRNLIYLEAIGRFSLPKTVCTFFPRFLSFLLSKHFDHFELGNKLFKVALSYSKNLESLKICSKFIEEHQCRSVVSVKLLCNFIEITLWHGYSPANLLHIFRTSFPKNTYGGLLLEIFVMVITKSLNVSNNELQIYRFFFWCYFLLFLCLLNL